MLVLLKERIVRYAVELGSGALMCVSSFVKTGSAIQKLKGG
jgi:hypothetical protein